MATSRSRRHHRGHRASFRRHRSEAIDAHGLVVAPGFIDIHSHGRRGIEAVPTAENYLREGVTTIIEGPDGSSPLPLKPFFDSLLPMPSASMSPASSGTAPFAPR